jgi:hypothetical protein
MLGKVITERVLPVGLSPAVKVVERYTTIHELILKGIARNAARKVHKPVLWGKRFLNAWNRGEKGISRELLADGSYRYTVLGKLHDKLPDIE